MVLARARVMTTSSTARWTCWSSIRAAREGTERAALLPPPFQHKSFSPSFCSTSPSARPHLPQKTTTDSLVWREPARSSSHQLSGATERSTADDEQDEEDDAAALPPAPDQRALSRLLPPLPRQVLEAASRRRSLLSHTTTRGPPSRPSTTATADNPLDLVTVDYAYLVVSLTPRRNGLPGKCPKGGVRGAEGQRLAAALLRSFRAADTRFAQSSLAPLQCWEKPGLFDQRYNSNLPGHAAWVFEARRWWWSLTMGFGMLSGDHTWGFNVTSASPAWFPRNSSCFSLAGKTLPENGEPVQVTSQETLPYLRGWCSVQNRAGRQALGLHTAYLTEASSTESNTCKDGLWNAAESGVDCGLACAGAPCSLGEGCNDADDCDPGISCDLSHFNSGFTINTAKGFLPLGGIGTCAQKCSDYTSCSSSGQILDERYLTKFCGVDTNNGNKCDGKTFETPRVDCCTSQAPCSSITTCNASQYPDPNANNRCSNVGCTGSDNVAKCCLSKALCSSAFTQEICTRADATSLLNASGYCSSGACNTTLAADKSACCTPRPRCDTFFLTTETCKTKDPDGSSATLTYTLNAQTRCASSACADSDWAACCSAKAACSTGFFDAGFTCAAGTTRKEGALCSGRTCTQATDQGNCCAPIVQQTCQAWAAAQPSASPACVTGNFGGVIANAASTNCAVGSNLQCIVNCCTSVGTVQTCDQIRVTTPTYCGVDATWFYRPPLYPTCSLSVSGSCDQACCKKPT